MTTNKSYRIATLIALGAVIMALAVVATERIQTFVAQGLKDSQKLRGIAQSNTCDLAAGQTPHFGGCSSIL